MGYRLYREVVEHGPSDLTSGEMLVWLIIADDANDDTRTGWIANDVLCDRARMTRSAVVKNLQRLAARGYELRVPRGKDKIGRVVYAYRGARSTYLLPSLTVRKDGPQSILSPSERVDGGPPINWKGWTTLRERVDHRPRKGGPPSTPSPQDPQSPQQRTSAAERTIQTRLGCTDDEAAAIVATIKVNRREIRSLPAVLPHMDEDELCGYLADVRAKQAAQAGLARRKANATCKTCYDRRVVVTSSGCSDPCGDCAPRRPERDDTADDSLPF